MVKCVKRSSKHDLTLCHTFSAVLAIEDHHQHGDISFYGAYEQDEFDLNSQIFDQQQELEQMIGKIQVIRPFSLYIVFISIKCSCRHSIGL
jgi:hypothetical protein